MNARSSTPRTHRQIRRRDEFRHWMTLPVRWGDMDSFGHVNNAKFFTYGEEARMAYFDRYAVHDPKFGKDYRVLIARVACDFIKQLHHPATVELGTRVVRMGRSSLGMTTAMFVNDALIAVQDAVLVWFDYLNQKVEQIPQTAREWIRTNEAITPQESE
jgi:acyl-CoA thioester hydrolase